MSNEVVLAALAPARYAQLRTYRRDGSAIDTPIWFHLRDQTLVFRTKVGPKTRRIANDPTVELWPCDYRGRYPTGAPAVRGRATILSGAAAEQADRALHRRYGWQYNIVPLLKLPGVKNVDHKLPLREKLRRATTKKPWPDSAIVEVTLAPIDASSAAPEPISVQDDTQHQA